MTGSEGAVIRRALVSVSDKSGLAAFARALTGLGVEIVSTGGSAAALRDAGIAVRTVEEVTGFPEMLDGRVRTLHPKIHGAILADRSNADHMRAIARLGIEPIDLVVVNFYPFARVFAESVSADDATELIDIGGPSLARAAAKNAAGAAPVTSPARYDALLAELRASGGRLSPATRAALRREAFLATAAYDAAIARFLGGEAQTASAGAACVIPDPLALFLAGGEALRYGENPHQAAALFPFPAGDAAAAYRVLGGKALSYNNLIDLDAAARVVQPVESPCVAIVKHTNPCGVAKGAFPEDAFRRAREGDPVSAFGGIVAVNCPVNAALAELLAQTFFEAVIAPAIDPAAVERLAERKNLRLVEAPALGTPGTPLPPAIEVRGTLFGYLAQSADRESAREGAGGAGATAVRAGAPATAWRLAAGDSPQPGLLDDGRFAWHVARHVKSNAIVLVRDGRTIGVGAGQMSRVESVALAIRKARAAGHDTDGCALASDGFFPFPDGVEEACAAGVKLIVQPGGSVKDDEVARAAERGGAAMLLTGRRHFRH